MCECVGGRRWGSGRLGAGGNPEWRGQGVAAGALEVCAALHIRWPKYWSFSFIISPSSEHPGLISFRMDWLDLLAVQGTLKSLLQYHSSKASILRCSAFFTVQLSHPYMTTGTCMHYFLQFCKTSLRFYSRDYLPGISAHLLPLLLFLGAMCTVKRHALAFLTATDGQ